MSNKTIKELAVELTVDTVKICDNIHGRAVFVNQLLRSCSSIGANSFEAKYAQSDADFIHKYEIALKESYETDYWYEILNKRYKSTLWICDIPQGERYVLRTRYSPTESEI